MKRSLVSGLLLGTAGLLLARKSFNRRAGFRATPSKSLTNAREVADDAARRYITYAIFPAWTAAGFLDWVWHRQTSIETTSGTEESLTHLLMMAEGGLPIILALFLEINAGVIALVAGGWLLHQLTVYWDLAYTAPRRVIYPREQQTHLFMQTVPFDILAMLACLHSEQFKALVGAGDEKPDFRLRLRRPGMPPAQALLMLGSMAAFSGLPHVEEFVRCWRAARKGLTGRDTPDCARDLFTS